MDGETCMAVLVTIVNYTKAIKAESEIERGTDTSCEQTQWKWWRRDVISSPEWQWTQFIYPAATQQATQTCCQLLCDCQCRWVSIIISHTDKIVMCCDRQQQLVVLVSSFSESTTKLLKHAPVHCLQKPWLCEVCYKVAPCSQAISVEYFTHGRSWWQSNEMTTGQSPYS